MLKEAAFKVELKRGYLTKIDRLCRLILPSNSVRMRRSRSGTVINGSRTTMRERMGMVVMVSSDVCSVQGHLKQSRSIYSPLNECVFD